MSLYYQPRKVALGAMRAVEESKDPVRQIAALTQSVQQLIQYINVELPRVAEANNGAGGVKAAIRTVTADSLVTSTDGTVLGDTSGGVVTVTLPLASEYPGLTVCFKRSAGASTYAVAPRGSDTIDGSGSALTVTTAVYLQADSANANWVSV